MKRWLALAWVFAALPAQAGWPPQPETTERVSVGANGEEGPYNCCAQISADGRYVLFAGTSLNHPLSGLLLKYRQTGAVEQVCRNAQGELANHFCEGFRLSADGRYILFRTRATNMGATPPFPLTDMMFTLVRDRVTGSVREIRPQIPGCPLCWLSGDDAALSSDGRFVALAWAVPGIQGGQIFKVEVESGSQSLVSSNSFGQPGNMGGGTPVMCPGDTHLLFLTTSSNFDPAFPPDSNPRLIRKNMVSGEALVVDRSANGELSNNGVAMMACGQNGGTIAFISFATNLAPGTPPDVFRAHVYVKDMTTGQIDLLSRAANGDVGNGHSVEPAMSNDGRRIVFRSNAVNLIAVDINGPLSDIFLWQAQTPGLQLVSVGSDGTQGSGSNGQIIENVPTPVTAAQYSPVMSADGLAVAYHAHSANLVPDDFNQAPDVFVRNLAPLGTPPPTSAQAVPLRSKLMLTLLVLGLLVGATRRSPSGARVGP